MLKSRTKIAKCCQRSVSYLRSNLFIPNYPHKNNEKLKESESKALSQHILENNGFISDFGSGLTINLPLGKRVLHKLSNVIRDEMNRIGGQEIDMPSLCRLDLWSLTGRNELMGKELFRLKDRQGKDLCLCPTHEETVTSLVAKFAKTMPIECLNDKNSLRLYQITRKYRDESRPKHGLLRTREFLMKDMYTFHLNEASVEETYADVCKAYEAIFTRLDLNYRKTIASVGSMGGKKSHEYHLESEIGEDQIFVCDACSKAISVDLLDKDADKKLVEQGQLCELVKCGIKEIRQGTCESRKCIEIGHTFILNDRYTKQIKIELARPQASTNVLMGCYGIGVSRLMQACVEANNESGKYPNWPLDIAPFQIAIISAKSGSKEEEKSKKMVPYLAEMLDSNAQFRDDVLVDDRDWMTIGSRLIDCKLMGIPFVIILGKVIHEEKVEIIINSSAIKATLGSGGGAGGGKEKEYCHSRETAHVLKQLINDYLYKKKEKTFASYFDKLK
jgi:prolyl-tRNA synthetase